MFALIAIAMLDTSGGILLVGMLALITWKCIQHKHKAALLSSPGILVLLGWSWLQYGHVSYDVLKSFGFESMVYDGWTAGIPQITGVIITLQMGLVWILSSFTKNGTEDYPFVGSIIWVIIGVFSASTSVAWLPTILVCIVTVSVISKGAIEFIPVVPVVMLISLIIGFSSTEINDPLEVISWSAAGSAVYTGIFYAITRNGMIFIRYNPGKELATYNARNPDSQMNNDEYIELQKESMLKVNEAFIIINLLLSFAILVAS